MKDYPDIVFWAVAPGAPAADIEEAIALLEGDPAAATILSALKELLDLPGPVYRRAVWDAARAANAAATAAASAELERRFAAEAAEQLRQRTGWRGLRRRVRSAWRTLRWRLWALRNERMSSLVEDQAS